ncbi:amino acid ABC transporter ATP-binding protein (PAAT family) [Saccharopolyspora erythraea NRRL 2338]|uniref:ATP-binding component of ABC transporter n=2 Tax=Saccharopolyspora erythraea TaxID=1836 RepID=A4FN13_SACEN|nr:ectoine/hydroxyectoine ABC transporter ATP-binding protein EhuA [Saccharopolyspora erythraea]EQD82583.1 peptide ABC transporter ATPase [Saccharopolyspora erythraea D]PFG99081.1 amino acid ABC transporter ATP-binding protein (PAAT family) [Saccharopolyspora erythraea NRRL 2338]QRK89042.1 ectoine/hydroxyectoine ABC transporter ATP-binding protein EhuA [Saccharopolyspora erythraea]CAM05438.1 putative ATP-binding component of ABC transporter [Saccharopolyspora erythraea NRRL 2338]
MTQSTSSPEPTTTGPRAEFIRFDEISKRFGDNVVLDDLSFSVGEGQRVTLIGPSGSGKTTILRMLMTLTRPDSGTIAVGGEYLFHEQRDGGLVPASEAHVRRVRGRITMVFQQYNLFPNMRVLRNVTEAPIHVLGRSREQAEQRGRELLDMVGLGEKLDSYPSQLSGGQQQRVAIARALAMDPDVLLLDEITSALDPELAAEVLDVLRDVARTSDITMLVVTHAMKFARDVSDKVLMFDGGKIIEAKAPAELFESPEHERTRSFLRSVIDEA